MNVKMEMSMFRITISLIVSASFSVTRARHFVAGYKKVYNAKDQEDNYDDSLITDAPTGCSSN